MQNIKFIAFFSFVLFSFTLSAQNTPPPAQVPKGSLSSGTLDSQFGYMLSISNSFQDFKVVRKTNLEKFRSNVSDSLNNFKSQISSGNAQLTKQKARIDSLQSGIQTAQNNLEEALNSKDNFSVLGVPIHKVTYSLIMWGLVIVLASALFFFIYRHRQSHVVTIDTRHALEELRQEFDLHRKKAMEREQKLNRQLVDEMNKRQG